LESNQKFKDELIIKKGKEKGQNIQQICILIKLNNTLGGDLGWIIVSLNYFVSCFQICDIENKQKTYSG
jgi:hypothetical protein